ncbi:hypothetical protein M569_13263, partial [Genlisea aurea]
EIEREDLKKSDSESEEGGGEEGSVQPWKKQITARGMIASALIGSIFSIIAMKLGLTTGISPHLNVAAAFLGFVFIEAWTKLLKRIGKLTSPFTKQENTIIQTCTVACYGIANGGGFASYLLGMNRKTFDLSGGPSVPVNTPSSIKEPGLGWMIGFLFLVCFIGLFVLIPLQKILIIDNKLTFPTGTATAVLINGFHNRGSRMAKSKQVKGFIKSFSLSLLWGFFKWFYTAKDDCGFSQFPTFGLRARKQTFYFDFSLTYVGAGMICPHIVNLSLLLGAVISYGLMWPLIGNLKGVWFPRSIPQSSMQSLEGYKVFISISLLLGDGLYSCVKILLITMIEICKRRRRNNTTPSADKEEAVSIINQVFIRERVPLWVGAVGYVSMATVSTVAIPFIFPELKWYLVLMAYVLTPSLAFCNAYGAGLTDINMSYNYGKLGLFIVAALSGRRHGVVAALAACGLFKSIINVSCILMLDMKTGHLTSTSPKAMLLSQAVGTALGCVVTPLSFFLFYRAFDVGNPDGEYKAPFAIIYRNIAILGVEGLSALPKHCLQLCYGFFAFGVLVNMVKDVLPGRASRWMPVPTAMAVPFVIGGYFTIDMCVGSVLVLVLKKAFSAEKGRNRSGSSRMVAAVASGLICGEGVWAVPASILGLSKVTPPICMKFLPASAS